MYRLLVASVLMFAVLLSGVNPAYGQLSAGVKVPPFLLPEVFVAMPFGERMLLEAGIAPILNPLSMMIVAEANAKLYLSPLEAGAITLTPFLGAGVGVASVLDVLTISPHVLVGVEYALSEIPLTIFGELGASVTITSLGMGVGIGGSVGARYAF